MKKKEPKIKIYPKGTICYRCGTSKKDSFGGCSAWGKYWSRHFYNSKPLEVSEVEIKIIK